MVNLLGRRLTYPTCAPGELLAGFTPTPIVLPETPSFCGNPWMFEIAIKKIARNTKPTWKRRDKSFRCISVYFKHICRNNNNMDTWYRDHATSTCRRKDCIIKMCIVKIKSRTHLYSTIILKTTLRKFTGIFFVLFFTMKFANTYQFGIHSSLTRRLVSVKNAVKKLFWDLKRGQLL